MKTIEKKQRNRKTGIDIVGHAPWGTHFCLFYQNKQDLIDVLVPYFKAGLQNNEFCMWVTSEPLNAQEANSALKQAVPSLDAYINKGQIEIIDYSQWYTESGELEADKVLQGWVRKHDQALKRGFDGVRLTGNTLWLGKRDWKKFSDYEAEVNNVIGRYRVLAVCSYSLDKCGASEIVDVVSTHQSALIKREGKWQIIESTEHKKSEEVIAASKERLNFLLSVCPAVIYSCKPSGDYGATFVSENIVSQTGYEPLDFIANSSFWADHIHPEDRKRVLDNVPNVFRKGYHCHEYRFLYKDGSYRWVHDELRLVRNADGTPIELVGYWIDITDSKKVKERLWLLSSAIEQSSEGIAVADLQGNLLFVNKAFAAMHCYTMEELTGKHLSTFHTPEQLPAVEAANRVLQEKGEFSGEVWHTRRDGSVFLGLMHNSLIHDEAGNAVGMIGTLRDVTERKQAEKEREKLLHEKENRIKELRCIFEVANSVQRHQTLEAIFRDVVALIPPSWQYPQITRARVRFNGEEYISEPFEQTKWKQTSDIVVGGKRRGSVQVYYLEQRPVLDEGPFLKEECQLIDGIARTLSEAIEHKQAEQALEKLNKNLEATVKELNRSNKELQNFAHIVSHDLKAPLRGIRTLASWISTDYADKLDKDGREKIDLLLNRVERMHNLIDGILQYSRIGRVKDEKIQVNLNELVPNIIDLIAPPESITVTVENELPVIECEKTRIIQVFQNLLSNAVKYMDKPQGQIRIGCVEENGSWKFSVADNGPGIEEKHFEKIFQIFQTLAPRDEVESTGVGLTLVKKIVEMYEGRIWVESKIGEGSTFFFTLPKQKVGGKNAELQASIVSRR